MNLEVWSCFAFFETLIQGGLARVYGVRTPLPWGEDSRSYLARLSQIESEAKEKRLGAWGYVLRDEVPKNELVGP